MKTNCSVFSFSALVVKTITKGNFDVVVLNGQQSTQTWFDAPKFDSYVKKMIVYYEDYVFPLIGKTKEAGAEKVKSGYRSLEGWKRFMKHQQVSLVQLHTVMKT